MGIGRVRIIIGLVLSSVVLLLGLKVLSWAGPTIELKRPAKGIGQNTELAIEARDSSSNVKMIRLEVLQEGHTVHQAEMGTAARPLAWWRFWSRHGESVLTWTVPVGRKAIPDLKEGRATLHVITTNDSWGRFFRGGRSELWLDLPVRFVPPQVQVLTSQHYINQGGCEMALFQVSPGTVESGIQAGSYFFPSWPVKASTPETRLCLFAFPYNLDPKAALRIVARDDAGNETVTGFSYKVFPKTFRADTINLTDDFMARVVPPILSQTPEIQDQGNLLRNFLLVNGRLREMNSHKLVALSHQTSTHFLWTQPFVPLSNSKVEAAFADRRTYVYNRQAVDHQDHLGFDLAVVEHTPVVAANDGVVEFAGFLGIYGNAIILDHGCGLQSLYGHLSSIGVKVGDSVKRGQVIGRSGQTGLAGGDHLHFTVLLDGIPVNPVEWWDPHWIHDRIEAKLATYR